MTSRHAALLTAALAIAAIIGGAVRGAFRSTAVVAPASVEASGVERAHQFWAVYGRAGDARTAGRLDEAVTLYRQALSLRPEHEDSLYYLASCLRERREYAEAARLSKTLIDRDPGGSSRGYMQLAAIRASLDAGAPVNLAEAERLYERALAIDPDSGALLGLAEVAVLQHRLVDAGRLLASVEADNPIGVAAPYLSGFLAFERRDTKAAWGFFTTAVSRSELKKGAVKWTEEGDVKASPELRWRALGRQSIFGANWLRLHAYLAPPGPARDDMRNEYERLHREMAARWR